MAPLVNPFSSADNVSPHFFRPANKPTIIALSDCDFYVRCSSLIHTCECLATSLMYKKWVIQISNNYICLAVNVPWVIQLNKVVFLSTPQDLFLDASLMPVYNYIDIDAHGCNASWVQRSMLKTIISCDIISCLGFLPTAAYFLWFPLLGLYGVKGSAVVNLPFELIRQPFDPHRMGGN